jgi:hypothetical protein
MGGYSMGAAGRNDPCPCGSGKKYKKCCLETDAANELMDSKNQQLEQQRIHENYGILSHEELIDSISEHMEWSQPHYEQVALLLAHAMHEEYESHMIYEAVAFWNRYANDTLPIIKKLKIYCAAIEYTIIEAYGLEGTQAELAEKYKVSVGSISKRFNEIMAYSEEGHDELDHDVFDYDEDEDENAKKYLADSLPSLRKAMETERKKLDKRYFKEDKGHFWMIFETRPFMRAKYSYAEMLWLTGSTQEAISELEEILELNHMDNLGARYLLLSAYLESKKLEEARELLHHYEDDTSAAFAYNRIVLEFQSKGITSALKMQYRVAYKQNPFVPDYLLGKKQLPLELPDYVGIGDENEAIDYVAFHARLWVTQLDLIQWMAEQ